MGGRSRWQQLAERLAAYHGCSVSRRYVSSALGRPSLVFEFRCGNGFSFDRPLRDNAGPLRALTYKDLVRRYMSGDIYLYQRATEFCVEWNDFPKRILKASSPEELDLKLAAAGF